ncbi:MAG: DUF3857 domain-containing protein [Chitinophagaceae bacterium]|nr:DUF3857 domain-containing protein [Chitinophagaceae bacterium]
MKRTAYLFILSILGSFAAFPQYDAASIPAALKEGASVIKRSETAIFEVKDVDHARYSIHRIYTILNEEGRRKLFFHLHTNKMVKIDEVDLRVYDESGRQVNRFKKKDLQKEASQGGLVEDGMHHWLNIPTNGYPVTIEMKYETIETSTLFYPHFSVQDADEAVESSTYVAIVPINMDLRYMQQKIDEKPEIGFIGDNKVYTWQIKNRKAYKDEANAINANPAILLAPNKFKCFNTYGDMSSWKSFGVWGYDLLKGIDELSPDRKVFFNQLVKDAKTDREKIAILYNYLQKNFRYVSIQLGIGGYKPFPAQFTDEKKYGDCKGLSFYMHAALKTVGVKSYCALINREVKDNPVPPAFPLNRFNHMILCVPQGKDTTWLECTSNTNEFGFLGSDNENRNALLLTENGGVLVATPKSKAKNTAVTTSTHVKLADDGSGAISTDFSATGDYKYIIDEIVTSKKDDQKHILVGYLGFKQPDEFSIVKKDDRLVFELLVEKIPQFSAGTKMFLNPRVNPIWSSVLPKSENRQQDYFFHAPFVKVDTTVYDLPAEYTAESVPPTSDLKCEFASYSTTYNYDKENNRLVSIARLELYQNRIPAGKYAEIKKFFDGVISADGQKLIIKKN